MKAVFDFGNAWLESAGKLTLHDPLTAVSIFHPELCSFEKGSVRVETVRESTMGGTSFTPDPAGNVEIARTVNREQFYRILAAALHDEVPRGSVPPLVSCRANAAGAAGRAWLVSLDRLISELEARWCVSVGEPLDGGTHAYVTRAKGRDGRDYVLKIDMPESRGHGDFLNGVSVLKAADGRGYARLYACDAGRRACLLERLGEPLKMLNYPAGRQIEIICTALKKSWQVPADDLILPDGDDAIRWFREFIGSTWDKLHHPCSGKVVRQAMEFLQAREAQNNPAAYVLLHGDAHSANVLQEPAAPGCFKLIDPDGIIYEKAYDLGVLMREWPEEYRAAPVNSGMKRCEYLHRLTGADPLAIWQWGFLQTVSTAFVLLQTGREKAGKERLQLAEAWCR